MGASCGECGRSVGCDCPASIRSQPAEWRLVMQGRLPMSMNERERCSHWKRRSELLHITEELMWLAREQRVPRAVGRRSVQVVLHKSLRSRVTDDPANRDSRAKSVLDALTRLGLLVDDNDAWLVWRGVVEGDKRRVKCTEVVIGEVAS